MMVDVFQWLGHSTSCGRADKLCPFEHFHWNRVYTFVLLHLICKDFIKMARLLANRTRKQLFKHNYISSIFSETWKTCKVSIFENNGYLGTNKQWGQTCLSSLSFCSSKIDHLENLLYDLDLENCNPLPIESIFLMRWMLWGERSIWDKIKLTIMSVTTLRSGYLSF